MQRQWDFRRNKGLLKMTIQSFIAHFNISSKEAEIDQGLLHFKDNVDLKPGLSFKIQAHIHACNGTTLDNNNTCLPSSFSYSKENTITPLDILRNVFPGVSMLRTTRQLRKKSLFFFNFKNTESIKLCTMAKKKQFANKCFDNGFPFFTQAFRDVRTI